MATSSQPVASFPISMLGSEGSQRFAGATVARAILLDIEYDPDPPFDAGHPDRAPEDVKALLSSRYEKARTAFRAGIEQSSVL
jgi:cyclohexyl-isocyanide hydratase